MADVDIEVESGDLKAAIQMLEGYEDSFVKMVNTVQTESNRMNRATKASADQIQTALDRMNKSASSGILADMLRKEQTEFVAMQKEISNAIDYWQKYDSQIGVTGKSASELGATFDKLGTILKQQESQTRDYWDSFNQSIGATGDKATELGATFGKLGDIIEKQAKQSKDYWDNFNKSLGIGSSATNAGAGFSALEKEIQSLTAKYAPLTAAAQFYDKEVLGIKRAHDLGLSSAKEMSFQLQNLEREYQALQKGSYIAGSRFNQFGEMADGSGKAAQRFGMYAQQAGYQIGDFAVQVQNGTNVGVAFSQQAAQLAGLIPGLAGAVTTFAAIGLGLLIQNLTRSEKEAKKTKEAYSEIGSTLDQIESIRKTMVVQDNLVEGARLAKKEYREVLELMERAALNKLKDSLKAPLEEIKKSVEAAKKDLWLQKAGQNPIDGTTYTQKDVEANSADKQNKALIDQQNILYAINLIQGDTREKLQENYVFAMKYLESMKLLNPTLLEQMNTLGQQLGIANSINTVEDARLVKQRELQASYLATTAERYKDLQAAQEALALEEAKRKFGEGSLEYTRLEREQKEASMEAQLRLNGYTEDQIDFLMQTYNAQLDVEQKIYDSANATDSFADRMARVAQEVRNVMAALSAIAGFQIDAVAAQVETRILKETGDLKAAARGRMQYQRDAKYQQSRSEVLARYTGRFDDPGYLTEMRMIKEQQAAEEKAINAQQSRDDAVESVRQSQRDAKKGSRGGSGKKGRGGKSDAEKAQEKAEKAQDKINEKFVDFIEDFALKMEQQKRLVGVQGKEREQLEKVIEIENRLGDARTLATDKQIEAWAKEELALQQRLENEKFLYDLGKDSFKSFLDSVITGTASIEDAFKTMLSNIIKEMYDKYVSQYAADVAGNFFMSLFSANGNAFGAGGVKMFAKGGVVDSPTAFRYSGGLGVMGEAGPEAIMPLKRNSQGKLGVQVSGGSNGDVKVTQVFQISANGDESVKQIIKSQMPQIQQAAVQGVIAAKRKNVRGLN